MAEQVYDVIIIGSGAGGGMATHQLANAGLRVALVEAGDFYDPADEAQRTQLRYPWESPRRGASTRRRPFGDYNSCIGGWELDGEPYTQKDGTDFLWWRARMLGGRTNHWGRISLRFGPLDFKRRDIDGLGDNWPIGYEDIKPYYDKVDKLIGVFGSNEGLYNDPDGFFLPAPKPRLHELYYIDGARKSNVPVIPARKSILTQRINNDRGVCFYCGQCSRACGIHADFSSSTVLIYPALNGGRVDLLTHAMVREITTDAGGRATGVVYIDRKTRREQRLRGRSVVLAASACSSARILLNSRSNRHASGLGNSSDHVGRYLHDSTGASRAAFVPELMDRDIYNEDGVGGMHVYSPWWLEGATGLDFSRGYHLEIGGGMGMPSYGFGFAVNQYNAFLGERVGGYGNQLRDDIRRFYGARLSIACRGESVPQYNNRCELDPEVVDEWGIPVLRFDYRWTEHEINQARHMQDTMEELLQASGGVLLGEKPGAEQNYGLTLPGEIIHEVGTTRMGEDPATSVTNAFGQLHDADNVFVVDGGTFVSQADKNPTWTILALAWRTSDYIVEQMRQGNIGERAMKRRETLKSLFLAPLAGTVIASTGCGLSSTGAASRISWTRLPTGYSYGRTEAEKLTDRQLFAETYFREHELLTIAVLCDIILPNDHPNGGALDAGLPDFVEFMVKDRERYKLPVRGGIAWLDGYAIERFGADFIHITEQQRLAVCDAIAYPDVADAELQPGIRFFSLMRDLTLTGYYTTEIGLRDLGYQGNTPNVWDGVPEEVLARHGKSYEPAWLAKCIDQSTRNVVAEWDDDMNLLSPDRDSGEE